MFATKRWAPAYFVVAALLSLLVLAACTDDDDGGATSPETASTVTQPPVTTTVDESLPPVVAARADVARRYERDPAEVQVVSIADRDWPDTCLGVEYITGTPEACAQVIVPGYEIVLRLDENAYVYHTDLEGTNVRIAGIDIGEAPTPSATDAATPGG